MYLLNWQISKCGWCSQPSESQLTQIPNYPDSQCYLHRYHTPSVYLNWSREEELGIERDVLGDIVGNVEKCEKVPFLIPVSLKTFNDYLHIRYRMQFYYCNLISVISHRPLHRLRRLHHIRLHHLRIRLPLLHIRLHLPLLRRHQCYRYLRLYKMS